MPVKAMGFRLALIRCSKRLCNERAINVEKAVGQI
jgi:hypothetical protein